MPKGIKNKDYIAYLERQIERKDSVTELEGRAIAKRLLEIVLNNELLENENSKKTALSILELIMGRDLLLL